MVVGEVGRWQAAMIRNWCCANDVASYVKEPTTNWAQQDDLCAIIDLIDLPIKTVSRMHGHRILKTMAIYVKVRYNNCYYNIITVVISSCLFNKVIRRSLPPHACPSTALMMQVLACGSPS